MNKYIYQQILTMGMKEELIAWEVLELAQIHGDRLSQGELVEEALTRVNELCTMGVVEKRIQEFYLDKDGWFNKAT